jgi:hypothetical protein
MQRWCHNILLRNTPVQKPGERLMQFLMALGLNLEMYVKANLTSRSSRIAVKAV